MPSYSIRDTQKGTVDIMAFTGDDLCINSMNSGRSAEMPFIRITNLNTGKIIYTGYAVKGLGAGNVEDIDYTIVFAIIIIIIIIILFAQYGG